MTNCENFIKISLETNSKFFGKMIDFTKNI